MTFIAVSIPVDRSDRVSAALAAAEECAENNAKLIEWRIDCLGNCENPEPGLRRLVRDSPLPCIITCRLQSEGGEYEGDEQARAQFYEIAASESPPPRYLDVEHAAYRADHEFRERIDRLVQAPTSEESRPSLILSFHDFDARPSDLFRQIESMVNTSACAVVKVAWHARSLRDNLEAFDLLAERRRPMLALCMGKFGLMSRVLAPKFGGLITYARNEDANEGANDEDSLAQFLSTAPGQPTVRELRALYRFESINPDTQVYGVIGWPVDHSKSPHLHNAGFEAVGHNGVYLPLPIPTQWEHFKATVTSLVDHSELNFHGASVTSPHKQHLLRFVREWGGRSDQLTDAIGAANTLIVGSAGGLECTNTDAPAAVETLCDGMNITRDDLLERKVAILGAGGVARAVAVGMAEVGANVIIFNRTQEKTRSLAGELSQLDLQGKIVPGKEGRIGCGCFDIIINCTTVGMRGGPAPHRSPLEMLSDSQFKFDENTTVFDTVYSPAETPFLEQAAAGGAQTISSNDMFLRQAAMQFERWTGHKPPAEIFNVEAGPY